MLSSKDKIIIFMFLVLVFLIGMIYLSKSKPLEKYEDEEETVAEVPAVAPEVPVVAPPVVPTTPTTEPPTTTTPTTVAPQVETPPTPQPAQQTEMTKDTKMDVRMRILNIIDQLKTLSPIDKMRTIDKFFGEAGKMEMMTPTELKNTITSYVSSTVGRKAENRNESAASPLAMATCQMPKDIANKIDSLRNHIGQLQNTIKEMESSFKNEPQPTTIPEISTTLDTPTTTNTTATVEGFENFQSSFARY
jgi:hypothetical protein